MLLHAGGPYIRQLNRMIFLHGRTARTVACGPDLRHHANRIVGGRIPYLYLANRRNDPKVRCRRLADHGSLHLYVRRIAGPWVSKGKKKKKKFTGRLTLVFGRPQERQEALLTKILAVTRGSDINRNTENAFSRDIPLLADTFL
jgi:hypothetical protein